MPSDRHSIAGEQSAGQSTNVPALLWQPSAAWRSHTHIHDFMLRVEAEQGIPAGDYEALWRWSVEDLEGFWARIWKDFGVLASVPYERVLGERAMPGAKWFAGAQLNYAENLLARPALQVGASEPAILHCSELRALETISRGELAERVRVLAGGLRELGIARGDRLVAYMPNIPETLIAFLACASLGAIFSSAAPELGARAVIDRFAQIQPRLLFTVDGYRYGGRDFDRRQALSAIVESLQSLDYVVALGYLDGRDGATAITQALGGGRGAAAVMTAGGAVAGTSPAGAGKGPRVLSWQQLERSGQGAPAHFEQVPFDQPLWVLYSSGTTGLPKAIVHGHGSMLLEQLKKSYLHLDLHRGERMFWYTTTAWMMWNFLVGCLLTEAAVVLYDGSPANPGPDTLWKLAEQAQVSTLGTSAGFLTAAMSSEAQADGPAEGRSSSRPADRFDLSTLRAVGSTGSPLSAAGFEWVYSALGKELWLYSTSGGTDVCTAFLGGCPILPVHAGELQCRALGCDVAAFDERGQSVVEELGELVVRRPMPSMPLFFWGDSDGSRLRESYFEMYPGIWRHGDWIRITARGSAVVYGRSDATINRGGVRIGTSELYNAVLAMPQVQQALVVDLPAERLGEPSRMLLFVVLAAGEQLDAALSSQIKARVRQDCSPRHVPDEVLAVADLPRTISGKLLEVPVKRILTGTPVDLALSPGSLANPESVEPFVRLARSRQRAG